MRRGPAPEESRTGVLLGARVMEAREDSTRDTAQVMGARGDSAKSYKPEAEDRRTRGMRTEVGRPCVGGRS